jgi:tetratricopeptide (TPR) repeat protein
VAPKARPREEQSVLARFVASVHRSPAFLIAAFLHLFLIVLFSFGAVASQVEEEALPIEVRVATSEPVRLERDLGQSDDDEPPPLTEVPVAAAPQLPSLNTAPSSGAAAEAGVSGLAAGGGGGAGGSGSGDGASAGSGRAVGGSLEWLARHQSLGGGWGWIEDEKGVHPEKPTKQDAARTGLALLCFLSAGHLPTKPGPYQKNVKRGLEYLQSLIGSEGRVQPSGYDEAGSDGYHQAIATLALAEVQLLAPEAGYREDLERAAAHTLRNEVGFSDQGVRWKKRIDSGPFGWKVMALEKAKRAGCEVPPVAMVNALAYFVAVTQSNGTLDSSDHQGCAGMAAEGLFVRLLLGQSPDDAMNRAAARTVGRHCYLESTGPAASGLYGVQFAMLGLPRMGGRLWRAYNVQARDQLVHQQVQGEGCRTGSWMGASVIHDRVLATCFATLTLQSYSRYQVPPQRARGMDEVFLASPEARALFAAEEGAARALAGEADLRAADARCARVFEALPKTQWEGRTRLLLLRFQIARKLGQTGDVFVQAYWKELPAGVPPDLGALSLARVEDGLALLARSRRALVAKAPLPPELGVELSAFALKLEESLGRLPPESAAPSKALLVRLREHELHFALRSGRGAKVLSQLVNEVAEIEPKGPPRGAELRLWLATCAVNSERLAAPKGPSPSDIEQARQGLALLMDRNLPFRILRAQAGRYRPLLVQTELNLATALVRAERWEEATRVCTRSLQRLDQDRLAKQVQDLLRQTLLQLAHREASAGRKLGLGDTRRLVTLIEAEQAPTRRSRRTLAACYERLGRVTKARDVWIALGNEGSAEQRTAARLALAGLERRLGRLPEALATLEALPAKARERLDVVLETCRVRRDLGKFDETLQRYYGLLRFVDRDRPEWWEVAYETGLTLLEAKRPRQATTFLEDLRRTDRSFGGSKARRARFLDLARRVELLASQGAKPDLAKVEPSKGRVWFAPYFAWVTPEEAAVLEAGGERHQGKLLDKAAVERLNRQHATFARPWILSDGVHELRTNVGLREAKRILALTTAFRSHFLGRFGDVWKFEVPEGLLPLIVTRTQSEFIAEWAKIRGSEDPKGHTVSGVYLSSNRALNPCLATFEPRDESGQSRVMESFEEIVPTLLHELTHQIAAEYSKFAAHPERANSLHDWAEEGLASFMGSHSFDGERWRLRRVRSEASGAIGPYASCRARARWLAPLSDFAVTAKDREGKQLSAQEYAHAAVLANYLLEGEGGRYRERFVRFLEAVHRYQDTPETLKKHIPWLHTPDTQDEWLRFVKAIELE